MVERETGGDCTGARGAREAREVSIVVGDNWVNVTHLIPNPISQAYPSVAGCDVGKVLREAELAIPVDGTKSSGREDDRCRDATWHYRAGARASERQLNIAELRVRGLRSAVTTR